MIIKVKTNGNKILNIEVPAHKEKQYEEDRERHLGEGRYERLYTYIRWAADQGIKVVVLDD